MEAARKQLEAAGAELREREPRGRQLKKSPTAERSQNIGSIKVTTERCCKGQDVSEL